MKIPPALAGPLPFAGFVLLVLLLLAPGLRRFGAASAHTGTLAGARGIYDFRVETMDSGTRPLSKYKGKVLLVVNTASKCGFTPQYKSLEALYEKYRGEGFEILAFPANNFHEQEPGTNAEIQTFCSTTYHTTFPLFAKIDVKGEKIAPLYAWLTRDTGFKGDIPWNFTKFLVARNGTVVGRFDPKVDPLDSAVTAQLETELHKR